MKALLLLVLPWLSPANYIDNVGNLHFLYSELCKGATHYGLHKEQKRRSEEDANEDSTQELTVANLSPELCASSAVALMTEEPSPINPALSPNTEDSQSGNSSEESSRLNRHRTRHFERSTVRSRSFKKLNRAFSVLRRTKSGSAVINPLERDRERESPPYPNPIEEVLPQLYHLIPDGEITNIKINRSEPSESLAIRIVGGSETPLVHIIIQHVYRDGVIARDGRLLPGDMILKVNGIDISSVPHSFAVSVLKQPCQVLRLTVLREQRYRCRNNGFVSDGLATNETLHITLNKGSQDVQLGIKLVRRLDGGVLIFSLQEGGVAARDRQLQENDRILAINGHDLRYGTPESAALLIQASEETVHFLVSRQARPPTPDILQEAGWNNNGSGSPPTCPMERNHINKSVFHAVTCHEKVVNINKDHTESLGMIVAGGVSHREWDLPIYVISVEPDGVISRDGRIKTGDILLSVNGIELTGVSRSEAVALLKNTSSYVVLKALETRENESQEDVTNNIHFLDANRNTPDTSEWSPAWVMWLKLPRYLCSCKEIVLRRNTAGSLGFSFVGGYEEGSGNKPFLIKSIVEGTPAYNDGRLRCGDVLLAVNGRGISGMMHCYLVKMLKELKGRVALAVVSWPGSLL